MTLKNGKVVKLHFEILCALLPRDNCISAVFQWCVPEELSVLRRKLCTFVHFLFPSPAQGKKADDGKGLPYSCMLDTQEKISLQSNVHVVN